MNAMATTTGRIKTDAPNYDEKPKRTRIGSVHHTGKTSLRANCGCGWTTVTDNNKLVESVIAEAFDHRAQTGHVIDILGIIR